MSVKIGIALGGGGARGLAHVGVLKALEEEGIPIHYITGSSIGAIVGAMYAQHPNADFLIDRFKQSLDEEFYDQLSLTYLKTDDERNGSFLHQATQNIKRRIVINLAQSREALLTNVRLRNVLSKFIDEGKIEYTTIPLGIVSTNLHTGDNIVFKTGDIITAVAASSSIPGYMSPLRWNGNLLADGAVSCPVPVQFLPEMGAELTIGVEICTRKFHPLEAINVIEIIARAEMIESRTLSQMMVKTADVAICPDTKDVYWSDFSRKDELIEAGIKSAREKLPEIKKAIQKKFPGIKGFFLILNFLKRYPQF